MPGAVRVLRRLRKPCAVQLARVLLLNGMNIHLQSYAKLVCSHLRRARVGAHLVLHNLFSSDVTFRDGYGRLGLVERRAAFVARDLTNALDHIHSRGIIHLDVKPENILVFSSVFKLCDFGLAMHDTEQAFRGTPRYASPEVYTRDHRITSAADYWSMGMTLIAIFTLKSYFARKNAHETVIAMFEFTKGIISFPKGTGDAEPLIRGLLRSNPTKRYGAGDVRRDAWACSSSPSPRLRPPRFSVGADYATIIRTCRSYDRVLARTPTPPPSDTLPKTGGGGRGVNP